MGFDSEEVIIIEPAKEQKAYLKDLFCYHELLFFFAWRDIIVRYKQAFFGVAWALIRPLLNMAVFAFLFGTVAQLPSDNVNYALFVLAAMLPWQLFSSAVNDTCNCLVNNAPLVAKVFFPRILIPIAQIIAHLLDFWITTVFLLILGIVMGAFNFLTILTLPLFIILLIALCLGIGFWLAALTVQYRDFRILVPFFIQFGMFISPVGYGTFVISSSWQWLYFLNPIVGVIDGFRWAFFGITYPQMPFSILFSTVITCCLLISGFKYFRKMERTFADSI